jgi:hypothetical protein
VVWTSQPADGAYWVGLQIVEECARRILRVRPKASPLALAARRRGA